MEKSNELKIAIETAKEAGAILLQYYGTELNIEMKGNNTLVSNADYAANDHIIKNLSSHFSYPILSEESIDDKKRLGAEKVWIIDPLDGTKDFIGKTGEFVVAIGLVENNQPLLGVVYNPITQEIFYAEKEGGAFRKINNKIHRLSVSKSDSVPDAKFVVSKLDDKNAEYMDMIGAIHRVRVGSAAYKICKVAQGEYDAYFVIKSKMSEWDDCAAGLILAEAGGVLSNVFGDSLVYNQENVLRSKGTVASNGVMHKELLERMHGIVLKEYSDNIQKP